ncbi:MAG: FlgD immunoglobulin-like domain containing protein, partial [bacterium]
DGNLNESFDFYRLESPFSNDEYIIENRQYSGLNSYLPEWWKSGSHGGLLVWWHASSTSQARTIRNADDDTDVILEGMPNVSDGDRGDPFPGTTGNTAVTPYTAPSTSGGSSGTGSFTGVALTDISNSTTNMIADLWADFPPAAPQNLVISNAGQNGQNIKLKWDANNETDLNHYAIYRGYQSGAGQIFWGGVVATTSNTNWTDTSFQINTSSSDKVHYRITAVDQANNESDYSNTVNSGTDDIPIPKKGAETLALPKEIALRPNYPNPFNPETQIKFELPEPAHVTLKVYNVLGKKVRTLVNGDFEANFHTVRWDGKNDSGKDLSSGVYIYTIQVLQQKGTRKPFTQTQKMTLLR